MTGATGDPSRGPTEPPSDALGPIEASTARTVTIGGRELLSFAGCGYLGLAHHAEVRAAAREALERTGVGALASRATSGTFTEHTGLEDELARFLGCEAALVCTDGYLADLAVLQGLASDPAREPARRLRVAVLDADAHPALRDGARVAGLETFEFEGGELNHALALMDRHSGGGPVLLTDGAFPSQGRLAATNVLLRHLPSNGMLVVDDSHVLGVLGERGAGSREAYALDDERLVITSSLAKGLGCAGGVVAGTRAVVESARAAPAFVGATPVPPSVAAAARAALRVLAREPERVVRLHRLTRELHQLARRLGRPMYGTFLPIVLFEVGPPERGRALSAALRAEGIFVPWVSYFGSSGGLRVTVTAEHEPDDLVQLEAALERHVAPHMDGGAA